MIPCGLDTFGWPPTNRRKCAVVWGEPMRLDDLPRNRKGYAEAGERVGAEIVRLWRLAAEASAAGLPPVLPDGARAERDQPAPRATLTAMASTTTRNLGRISEIAQVAVKHGFGYFFETAPADRPAARDSRASPPEAIAVAARPAPARDARRARPDLRQVRPAALDAARRRAAGHRGRAAGAPGRRAPLPVRGRRAGDPRGARPLDRAAVHRVRPDPGRRRLDRPGAPRDPSERPARRGQGAAAERAEPDRGRPRAPLPGGAARPRARAGARLHRRAPARRRVRALDPPGARLPARGPQRRGLPPPLLRPPARADPARLLELHAHARAHARAPRRHAARRPAARRLGDGGAPRASRT